jgi:hypothetical protein
MTSINVGEPLGKLRSDLLIKDYEITCAQIRDMVSYSDRMFGVGVTLVAAGFSYGVKEKLAEVIIAVSFLNIALLVFASSLYTGIFALGGYRRRIEEELNGILGGDSVLRWESVVPAAVHRSLPMRGFVALLLCLLVAVNYYGWRSATSLLSSHPNLLLLIQIAYVASGALLIACYASTAATYQRAYDLSKRTVRA